MRVWKPGTNPLVPGLTMTRSFGDLVAKQVGIIALPEVTKEKIESSIRFVVMASDGIWEVLTSEDVTALVGQYAASKNPAQAVQALADHAMAKWEKKCANYTDDISIIVRLF